MTELLIALRTAILSVASDKIGDDYFLGVAEGNPEYPYVVVNDNGTMSVEDSTSGIEIEHRMITITAYSDDDSVVRNLIRKISKRLTRGARLKPNGINVHGTYLESDDCRQEESRDPNGPVVWRAAGIFQIVFQEE